MCCQVPLQEFPFITYTCETNKSYKQLRDPLKGFVSFIFALYFFVFWLFVQNEMLEEGHEYAVMLYTWRSCSRAIPQVTQTHTQFDLIWYLISYFYRILVEFSFPSNLVKQTETLVLKRSELQFLCKIKTSVTWISVFVNWCVQPASSLGTWLRSEKHRKNLTELSRLWEAPSRP